MTKHFKSIAIALIAIFAFSVAYAVVPGKAKINETAPVFTLKDSNGKEHSLSDFKGKIVVLEWINFDCPFVKKHYDGNNMQSLQKKYTDKGVIWLSICSSAEGQQGNFDNSEINKRIKDKKAAMTAYLIDETGEVGGLYSAKTTPHMYVIDKSGKLVYAGAIDDKKSTDPEDTKNSKNYVAAALDELLAGKAVSEAVTTPYGCSVKYKK
jgi:peroxiredoxin